ncbi:MAG: hypothetical protein GY756_15825 [bacterium]|nr:hypothetical protein [bacterium]
MNRQKEYIDSVLEKVAIVSLFLFILFALKSTDCSNLNSFNKSTTIEHVLDLDNSAIFVNPVSFSSVDNSLVACKIFTSNDYNKSNNIITCSDFKEKHSFKTFKKLFLEIKPQIFSANVFRIKNSLNDEEFLLIS